jgi:glycosyltransferase involved in cell wall biosynthesis/SAM-dependent methyltransferase
MTATPLVSVVMIFFNAERFMQEALASVSAQTYDEWELILVDDGSGDGSTAIARAEAARLPHRVRYLEHPGHRNRGMSPSRALGVANARGALVAFLDADDTWLPGKLHEQVAILGEQPAASAVYGTPLYWHSWSGEADDIGRDHVPGLGFSADKLFEPPELLFLTAPFGDGPVPCPSDILLRRDAIVRVGGFEPGFRGAYEDVAFFSKLYLHEPVVATTHCWTRYRIHPESCMSVTVRDGRYQSIRLFFLNWFEQYLSQKGLTATPAWSRLQERLAPYRHPLAKLAMIPEASSALLNATPNPVPLDSSVTTISWRTPDASIAQVWISRDGGPETLFAEGATGCQEAAWINPGVVYQFRLYGDTARATVLDTVTVSRLVDPGVGGESFGSLRRVVPLSRAFGFDRGQPIDRYYIDGFLHRHAEDIRGRVLEVGESTYTRRFGGDRVSAIDVLHVVEGNPEATIVADLSKGDLLPSAAFDCVVLIQTLHLIFDVPAAIRTVHRILKPGGVLLATFPGLSQRSGDQWDDSWYWGFTTLSARRLFGEVFPANGVTAAAHGNVLATTAFLDGMASSELSTEELDYVDDRYETLVVVRAVKPAVAP